jgi:hypothetical protein
MFIRLVLGNIGTTNARGRGVAADLFCILLGAALILGAIFWPFP